MKTYFALMLAFSAFSANAQAASLTQSGAVPELQPSTGPTTVFVASPDTRVGDYFDFDGAKIFYQVAGSGQPLLLVHGFPLSGELFEHVRSQLSMRFKVITPDLPGFGKSTAGNAPTGDAGYARAMIALLNHLNAQKVVIGGHSMGGQIVLEMYKSAPARFSGVILFDTNPKSASVIEKHEFPAFAEQANVDGIASLPPIVVPQMITGLSVLTNKIYRDELTGAVQEASISGLRAGGATLALRPDYTSLLPTITVPALVIVGIDDQIYAPPISAAASKALPNSRLYIIPASAHAPMFERPDLVNAAILNWASTNHLGSAVSR